MVKWLDERRRRRDMAVWLAEAEANGKVLIAVPAAMAAEVQRQIWLRNVEAASTKWEAKVDNIPVTEWQSAVGKMGRRYRGQHRD